MRVLEAKPKQQFACLTFAPNSDRLFVGDYAGGIEAWDFTAGTALTYLPAAKPPRMVRQLQISPDGRWVYAAAGRHGLRLLDLPRQTCSTQTLGWADVGSVALSPDGARLVVGGLTTADGNGEAVLRGFVCGSGAELTPDWEERLRRGYSLAAAFFPDRKRICSAECWAGAYGIQQATVVIRKAATGEPVWRCPETRHLITGPAVSPTGAIITACADHHIHVWSLRETERTQSTVTGDTKKHFTAIAFHPSEKYLAATSNDATVKLFDTTTWEVARTFTWDIGRMRSVAFSPDGALAAAGSDTGKVVVWDVDV
jgi:WD40 repeat protein